MIKDFVSDSQYTKAAKKMFDKYNLNIDDQRVAHALSTSQVNDGFINPIALEIVYTKKLYNCTITTLIQTFYYYSVLISNFVK